MKIFSILSVIISTLLIGYFFIVGLPKIASINHESGKQTGFAVDQGDSQMKKRTELILRDKCNSYLIENNFKSSIEADLYLESCLKGEETSSINVIKPIAPIETASTSNDRAQVSPRLSQDELTQKCNDFMTRARFDSQKSADTFLKNCLAGK